MSEGNHRKNELKIKCRSVGMNELDILIKEKEAEIIKINSRVTLGKKRYAYSSDDLKGRHIFPIKTLKKDLAIMKTIKNERKKGV